MHTTDRSTPQLDPVLILGVQSWGERGGGQGVTQCDALPLTVLCPSSICSEGKTIATTSSVSQVSPQTCRWDNFPRSSFLVCQLKASVCPSIVSFTFSHYLCTFIIQICVYKESNKEQTSSVRGSICVSYTLLWKLWILCAAASPLKPLDISH